MLFHSQASLWVSDKSYSYYPPTFSDRALLDYLQGEDPFRNERKKSISSPFRERVEKDRERQREQFAKLLLTSLNSGRDDGVIYGEMTDDFIDEQPKTSRYYKESLRKRGNKYYQPESLSDPFYALSTLPRDEIEDDDIYYGERNNDIFTHHKRFPVSKRSSSEYDFTNLRKRSPNKEPNKKTDPKVEKELSNIFGPPKKEENKTKPAERKKQGLQKANTKEVAAPVISKSEPFEIKKKSIDWSDYFGLDRRKKSDSDLDKEWLMERYHKAVSMTAKRSNEYPLKHFHNHDQPQTNQEARHQQQQQQEKIKNEQPKTEEAKIKEIDEKLKNIEDAIVDDALKYTGAHEGTTDSKEAQEVKDRVISRLAAAYSLEKMRRALGEYKLSIAKERNRLKQAGNSDDYLFSEEKRVSVPRKQAIDEEAEKTQNIDNSIKCKGDNCNYKVPSRILDQYQWGTGKKEGSDDAWKVSMMFSEECPKIQRECNDLAASTGKYSRTFEIACNIHQLCLLCVSIHAICCFGGSLAIISYKCNLKIKQKQIHTT